MKKEKILSPEKIAKIKQRELREIERLEKQQARPQGPGYLIYLILIITIVYIADEITTQIGTQMQSIIASELFAPIVGEEFAVARLSLIGSVTGVCAFLSFFYKTLSDRYGRKIFLVINTLGMGVGMILISVATGIPVYVIGSCMIMFFVPNDMQTVYILETTPAKHRGKIYSIIKALATLGMMLVPVLRNYFIPSSDLSGWRYVYLVPALVAFVIAIFALIFVRESSVFVENRLKQLRMTDEERLEAKQKKDIAAQSRGGMGSALKFAFSHKQLRWIFIAGMLLTFGTCMTQYYESTMNYGYASQFLANGADLSSARAEATAFVTQALMLFPIGSAFIQLIQGFMADKWGRKSAVIIMATMSVTSFALFFIGSNQNWNTSLVGFLCGMAVGGYWAAGDIVGNIMCSESAPTNLRVSVTAAKTLMTALCGAASALVVMVLGNVLGDAYIGITCLLTAIPGMLLGLIFICINVKETKGIDLNTVRGDEFDTPKSNKG